MTAPSALSASSFTLTDDAGRERAKLSVVDQVPSLMFYDAQHVPRLQVGLNADGFPQFFLYGLPAAVPTLKIECDPLGSHVLLTGGGRAQSYLFLKTAGGSGLVLFGPDGQRQVEVLLTDKGVPRWTLWDTAGEVTASSAPPPS